jgi:hypothetical protein
MRKFIAIIGEKVVRHHLQSPTDWESLLSALAATAPRKTVLLAPDILLMEFDGDTAAASAHLKKNLPATIGVLVVLEASSGFWAATDAALYSRLLEFFHDAA